MPISSFGSSLSRYSTATITFVCDIQKRIFKIVVLMCLHTNKRAYYDRNKCLILFSRRWCCAFLAIRNDVGELFSQTSGVIECRVFNANAYWRFLALSIKTTINLRGWMTTKITVSCVRNCIGRWRHPCGGWTFGSGLNIIIRTMHKKSFRVSHGQM